MSFKFSSNGNNNTFKKLDNMLISMPESDGQHVLVREREREWLTFFKLYGRRVFCILWKSIMSHCLNISTHSQDHLIINGNSNYLLVYIWSTNRLHVTIQMIPYSMNVIQLNRLLVRVTRLIFQWMVCHCSMYYSFNKWYRWYVTLIEWKRIVQFHFLLAIVTKHFNHTELVCWWNWSMQLITHIFNGQLEFEFTIQVYDIIIHILEYKHQSIKSVNHRYTNVSHRSTIVGRWIINDHCGEQIVVVLVCNLHIWGSYQRWIHLDYLTISSDINHIRSIEWSR